MTTVKDRFLKYARIHTTSDRDSETGPSSAIQFDLARALEGELREIGLEDVELDENCYLMATLPANTDKPVPTIGFIAHMDTSPEAPSENINPQVHYNYRGGDITLNEEKGIVLSPRDFPDLRRYKGKTIITSDGTTLLGADDKAGVGACQVWQR